MARLRNIYNIALNSLRECIYSNVLFFFIVFSVLMVLFAVLLGVMAVDNEKRTLMDFSLAMSELTIFAFSIFYGSMTVQKEIETKTIYLIISRPIHKSDYIAGKLIGIYLSSALLYFFVSLINIAVILLKGYTIPFSYFLSIIFSFFKIVLISSFAMLITSFTTSMFSSVLISILLWILGHFISEMKYLFDKLSGIKLYILKFIIFILPNFQIFNIKDTLQISSINYSNVFAYFILYLSILFFANIFVFRKKEF